MLGTKEHCFPAPILRKSICLTNWLGGPQGCHDRPIPSARMGAYAHMNFEELKLAPAILQAVHEQGYTAPTPIQSQAIPAVLAGHDLLAGAQTGTGKTAAFTLPLLQRLMDSATPGSKHVRALVLTPTRELAAQVEESVRGYAKHLSIRSTVIFGGVGMKPQIDRIARGVDVLVATPGRLLDLQQQGHVDLSRVEILVLDEADRMLDMGFIHDVKKILALLPKTKQSLLFSATFSDEIRELAGGLLKNPQSIQVTPRNTTVQRIRQVIHPVGRAKKKQVLLHTIQQHDWSQVLVFTRTKFGANNVADYLAKNGVSAMALHGNKSQSARTQALEGFKTGQIRALVATDIAARGIDIDDLPHVVNYEIPNVPEDYVHRIGRTGRAGREGHAVSLVCMDEEGFMMEIERFTKQEIPVQVIEGFGPDEGEQAEPIAMGRQTLWGGAGKPPGREVMQAAAKAARQEMMERMRSNKAPQGGARGARREPAGEGQGARSAGGPARPGAAGRGPRPEGQNGPGSNRRRPNRSQEREQDRGSEQRSQGPRHHDDSQPRSENAHLGTQLGFGLGPRHSGNRGTPPDPMRTSIDIMSDRGRRGGNGGGGGGGSGRRSGGGRGGFSR